MGVSFGRVFLFLWFRFLIVQFTISYAIFFIPVDANVSFALLLAINEKEMNITKNFCANFNRLRP